MRLAEKHQTDTWQSALRTCSVRINHTTIFTENINIKKASRITVKVMNTFRKFKYKVFTCFFILIYCLKITKHISKNAYWSFDVFVWSQRIFFFSKMIHNISFKKIILYKGYFPSTFYLVLVWPWCSKDQLYCFKMAVDKVNFGHCLLYELYKNNTVTVAAKNICDSKQSSTNTKMVYKISIWGYFTN